MIEFPNDVTRLTFAGDWHCNYKYAQKAINDSKDSDVLLHVGDFGYHFPDGYLNVVNEAAERANLIVMFVDGNHENFDWLYDQPVSEDGVRRLRERVWHLPRAFRWEWSGIKFLALGGAHSVDRQWRTPGAEWWPQETLTQYEFAEAVMGGIADVMITHDCPEGVAIPGISNTDAPFPKWDLLQALDHRTVLSAVTDDVQPYHLFHGHYHVKYDALWNGINIHGLGMDGKPFEENLIHCSLEDLRRP